MEKLRMTESLREELLAQPVLGVITDELKKSPESFCWVGLSGSKARGAELGTISDDDLVILLGNSEPMDPLNMKKFDVVLSAINRATERLVRDHGIIPVFASTIRLEDAMIAMAKMMNDTQMRVHMVHLLAYPSTEAAVAFEPPALNKGLFGKSLTLAGDGIEAAKVVELIDSGHQVDDPSLRIGGLDGISDNFRMLMVNKHILPAEFLGPQVIHVLDYTLKWIMATEVTRRFEIECGTWGEILQSFAQIPGGSQLVDVVNRVRGIRSEGALDLQEVESVTREVIRLWPVLANIRNTTL